MFTNLSRIREFFFLYFLRSSHNPFRLHFPTVDQTIHIRFPLSLQYKHFSTSSNEKLFNNFLDKYNWGEELKFKKKRKLPRIKIPPVFPKWRICWLGMEDPKLTKQEIVETSFSYWSPYIIYLRYEAALVKYFNLSKHLILMLSKLHPICICM